MNNSQIARGKFSTGLINGSDCSSRDARGNFFAYAHISFVRFILRKISDYLLSTMVDVCQPGWSHHQTHLTLTSVWDVRRVNHCHKNSWVSLRTILILMNILQRLFI